VGVWKYNNIKDNAVSYFNGNVDTTGNYISQVQYAGGTVGNLTNNYNSGVTAVQMFSSEPDSVEIRKYFTWREMWDFSGTPNHRIYSPNTILS
jgi:hypothetical protein